MLLYIAIVSTVPMVLLWVALKQPGIDLQVALEGPSTFETFMRLFNGTSTMEESFRLALKRSLVYATLVASITTLLATAYALWASGWPNKRAISISFTLLTLVLLPQTYLVLPMLGLLQETPIQPPKAITIMVLECLVVLPLSAFALYLLAGEHARRLANNTALDSFNALGAAHVILREGPINIGIVFGSDGRQRGAIT
ncbi:MAG: hypothetical protein H0U97_03900 [Gammaproteobacteria bacterium]|nr:hypothetical protein [Gammaproteobacteria bacterium]